LTTVVSQGLSYPYGVAVDSTGKLYISDNIAQTIDLVATAFVNSAPRTEGPAAGSDALPPMLGDTTHVPAYITPTSDQSWLTITGVTNGVLSYSFTANSNAAPRMANISLLGQTIPITQSAAPLPPTIANLTFNASKQFGFQFTGVSNSSYTVLCSTNLALPLNNWIPLNPVVQSSPGQYQFTDTNAPASFQRFYRVRSP
jgi:hypothetical protein